MTPGDLQRLPPPWKGASAVPLAGDASTRRWYRLTLPGQAGSAVLMAVPPETPAVAADTVATFRLLSSFGWPVPEVLWHRGRRAIVSDAGDLSLEEAARRSPAMVPRLYRDAVRLLAELQTRGTPLVRPRSRWARRGFTTGFFMEELEVTERHWFRGALSGERPGWRGELACFLAPLGERQRVLCHRDYHSRNLMVGPAGGLTVIDCQDARLGPPGYDLVSLLRDSYLDLPAGLEEECVVSFGEATGPQEGERGEPFRTAYLRCAVQRHLKVLGTFARLADRGRPAYLAWVPRTLSHLRSALAPFPELAWLGAMLPGPDDR